MCTGLEIAAIGGLVLGGAGMVQQGAQARGTAEFNARLNEIEAQDALELGSQEEARYRRDVQQLVGAQKVAFGARNVQRSSGSALDLLGDTAAISEEDALRIRANAAREAAALRAGAKGIRREGRGMQTTSLYRAGSTLLTSGAQAYGFWKQR